MGERLRARGFSPNIRHRDLALRPDDSLELGQSRIEGPEKRYHPRGFVLDRESNAVWGMRFIWPFKADYRIVYLTPDYSQTVIGREARDYVWIMARTPAIPEADYQRMVVFLQEQGYDVSRIQRVPQRWSAHGTP